jgi:hypothetical protein
MIRSSFLLLFILFIGFTFNVHGRGELTAPTRQNIFNLSVNKDTILFPGETHFSNIRQLTFGGDNAEAYVSFDGKWLIFQKTNQL